MPQSQPLVKQSQQSFQDRLNQIVKLVRQRQQSILQVIQYLQQILLNAQQLSSLMFLQDEISKHRQFLQKVSKKDEELSRKCLSMVGFYQSERAVQLDESEVSLVRRVCARILQMFQLYNEKVEKYPMFQTEINIHYRLIKPKILKQITLIDKNPTSINSISQLSNSFFIYLQNKFNDQCKKVNKVIQLIQNGEINQIHLAFVCDHCKEIQLATDVNNRRRKPSQQKEQPNNSKNQKITSLRNTQPIAKSLPETQQQKYFNKEKQKINQKLKTMRQQAKQRQIIKKKKLKFATKYYSLINPVMDLHKVSFVEEMTILDENQQRNKLLADMEQRNKFNLMFIHEYIIDCRNKNMEEKVENMRELLVGKKDGDQDRSEEREQVRSVNSSNKDNNVILNQQQQDHIIQNQTPQLKFNKLQEYLLPQTISHPEIIIEPQQKAQLKSFRITNQSKKPINPAPKSNPNLFAVKQFGKLGQTFNFVKINMKNPQIHRSRLPDISNRMFSMQEKQKSAKIIQRLDNLSPNNHLLIIKTSLSKPMIDPKRIQKKTRKIEQNHGNTKRMQSMVLKLQKNQQKKEKMQKCTQNLISPMTIGSFNTVTRGRKVKRSDSGNKVIVQSCEKGSFKSMEINYSAAIGKKIRNFGQVAVVNEDIDE